MTKLFGTLAAVLFCCFSSYSNAQADALNPDGMINVMPGADDATVQIDLGHVFPYYGGLFTNAWMSTNGVILLYDPITQFGNPYTGDSRCCTGYNPSGYNGYFSYMLAPLWTDLIDRNLTADDGYYYSTDEGGSSFLWYNVNEFYNNNTNTFQVNLWPDGSFDFLYDEVDITDHDVWIGFTGDASYQNSSGIYEEVNELMFAQGGMTEFDIEFHDATFPGGRAWYGEDGGYDSNQVDCSNPLNDPSCSGYEEAYFNQQCEADTFYSQQCPGYEQAYFDLQCSMDALYDTQCPGYEQAYFETQCNLDPLYDSQCPGYEEAYFDQQCEADPLYDSQCPGYEEAYFDQQCSIDSLYDSLCPGYEEAYFSLQCSIDALYDSQCPGYQEAYELLLYTQACEANPLFDTGCDGYEEALAIKMLEEEIANLTTVDASVETQIDTGIDTGSDTGAFIDDGSTYEEPIIEETPIDIFEEPIIEEEMLVEDITGVDILDEEIIVLDEEPIIEEDIILEDKILVEEEDIIEEEIIEEIEEEVVEDTEEDKSNNSVSKRPDVLSIVLDVLEADQQLTQEQITLQQEAIQEIAQESSSFESSDFTTSEDALQDGEISITSLDVVEQTSETSEQLETVEDASFSASDAVFENQMNDSFAAGGSIGTFLSGQQPDYGKFDVTPPSVEQQRTLDKAETIAEKMSEEEIASLLKSRLEQLEDAGGFEGDQTITLLLMNGQTSLALYYANLLLLQQTPDLWYAERSIYKGNRSKDNMPLFLQGIKENETKMRELVDLQYRR